uniref:Uncharacterized protein n=1 Tax=Strongyloides papillosus TaxID=174720 RepID=A0A0N5BCG7_STREA
MTKFSAKVIFICLVILIIRINFSSQFPFNPNFQPGFQNSMVSQDYSNFMLELKVDKLIENDEQNFEALEKYITGINNTLETLIKLLEHLFTAPPSATSKPTKGTKSPKTKKPTKSPKSKKVF